MSIWRRLEKRVPVPSFGEVAWVTSSALSTGSGLKAASGLRPCEKVLLGAERGQLAGTPFGRTASAGPGCLLAAPNPCFSVR